MESITVDTLLNNLEYLDSEQKNMVMMAYSYADDLHRGQLRQSGEPYITHPLNVAYILSDMHADIDTLCAGLLHDTLEDTNTSKEEIAELFNRNIANLVDGVTKISKLNFSTKQDQNFANTRKIIAGITDDVRIIIIKLADRLHNMRTLQFKSEFKQKENSVETMEIFVPLAYYIGAYRLKSELEDLSLQYLKPDTYKNISERKLKIEDESSKCLNDMLNVIKQLLKNQNIPYEIKIRTKNIYGIYKRMQDGHKLSDIHDLFALKVMVDNIENCYVALGLVHSKYHPINDKFKDYICSPKTNMYSSLHTTVFGEDDRLVQTQIRTFDMDRIASFGLTAYWDIYKDDKRKMMQEELKKFQFFNSLVQINHIFCDNKDFVDQVKKEVFSDKVYVYTPKGEIIELPKGSNLIDFAYTIHTDIGNTMIGAYVNDDYVSDFDYKLQNKDRVRIITDQMSYGPRNDWYEKAMTTNAKRKIKDWNRK